MSNNDLPAVIKALVDQYGEDAVKFELRHHLNRGTHGGYTWHQYNNTPPCDDCKAGESEYQTERQRRKKNSSERV